MDIDDYMKQNKPGMKKSRLVPFQDEILKLKDRGYTDQQIRDWLAESGVDVSREAVRKFIKKSSESSHINTTTPPQHETKPGKPDDTVKTRNALSPSPSAQKIKSRLEEQKAAADATRFKHDKSGKK